MLIGGKMNIVEPIRDKKDIKKIEKILKNKSLRDLLMFVMGTNSGLRISDILALNVGDVKNKTHINIIEKKTGKRKKFPINSKLKALLDPYIVNKVTSEPLFKSRFDNRLDRVQAYRIINDACTLAGLNYKVGTHTLRKTFGYHHYQQYKDVAMLQKIFNHSSPTITLRYIGIEQDEIDESYNNFIL
jgi:integrase